MTFLDRIREFRKGGAVKRYHIERLVGQQSVAEHTWGVLLIIDCIWGENASPELWRAALYHDVHEGELGDIPITTKKNYKYIQKAYDEAKLDFNLKNNIQFDLQPLDKLRLRLADGLELLFFCIEQRRLGNKDISRVFNKGIDYVDNIIQNIKNFESPQTMLLLSSIKLELAKLWGES